MTFNKDFENSTSVPHDHRIDIILNVSSRAMKTVTSLKLNVLGTKNARSIE